MFVEDNITFREMLKGDLLSQFPSGANSFIAKDSLEIATILQTVKLYQRARLYRETEANLGST